METFGGVEYVPRLLALSLVRDLFARQTTLAALVSFALETHLRAVDDEPRVNATKRSARVFFAALPVVVVASAAASVAWCVERLGAVVARGG